MLDPDSIAYEALGPPGFMLTLNKRPPRGAEDHEIYWNACVFDQNGRQIWYGDIDLTESSAQLEGLADTIGTVFVTPELPWRNQGFQQTIKSERDAARAREFLGSAHEPPHAAAR